MPRRSRLWKLRKLHRSSKQGSHSPAQSTQATQESNSRPRGRCHIDQNKSWTATFDCHDLQNTTICLDRTAAVLLQETRTGTHQRGRVLRDASFLQFDGRTGEITVCERWGFSGLDRQGAYVAGAISTTVTMKPGTYKMSAERIGHSSPLLHGTMPDYQIALSRVPNQRWCVKHENTCESVFAISDVDMTLSHVGTLLDAGQERLNQPFAWGLGHRAQQTVTIRIFRVDAVRHFSEDLIRACGDRSQRMIGLDAKPQIESLAWEAFEQYERTRKLFYGNVLGELCMSIMRTSFNAGRNGKADLEDFEKIFMKGWDEAENEKILARKRGEEAEHQKFLARLRGGLGI